MPIFKTVKVNQDVSWALWKIEEPVDELSLLYSQYKTEQLDLDSIKVESRKKESLAARLALRHLLEQHDLGPCEVYKDEFGKPHVDHDQVEMSISHANGFGAAAININGPIGIDIEYPRDQIVRISRKFLHESEKVWAGTDVRRLTMIWCAKEALYKLHGRTQLIFSDQLVVQSENSTGFTGSILESGITENYTLAYSNQGSVLTCLAY